MSTLCSFVDGWSEPVEPEIELKKCTKCLIEQPLDEFTIRQHITGLGGKNGLSGRKDKKKWRFNHCKTCKNKEVKVIHRLKKIYPPPTSADYKCPGCDRTDFEIRKNGSEYGTRTVWRLHHNHITDEFEGYFCDDCNASMGRAQDDPKILRSLAENLEKGNNGSTTIY